MRERRQRWQAPRNGREQSCGTREACSQGGAARCPEPLVIMRSASGVGAGGLAEGGPLAALYARSAPAQSFCATAGYSLRSDAGGQWFAYTP